MNICEHSLRVEIESSEAITSISYQFLSQEVTLNNIRGEGLRSYVIFMGLIESAKPSQ